MYEKDYLLTVARGKVHMQYIAQRKALGAQRGSSVTWPIIERMTPQTTALTETSDVTPTVSADNTVSISVTEYGAVKQITKLLEATAYTDVHKAAAEVVGQNFVDSMELRARYALIQGNNVYKYGNAARTSLTKSTAEHQLTYNNLIQMKVRANALGLPPWDGEQYVLLIPPQLEGSILTNTDFKAIVEYGGAAAGNNMFRGEIGSLGGFRIVVSPWAKVYWGGGTASGASTTISGAHSAGATTVEVADATSIAVGDTLRLETAETVPTVTTTNGVETRLGGCEVVQVTAVSGTTLTVVGAGNKEANLGLVYSHATGATAVECESVGTALVLGRRSCGFVYSDKTGPNGKHAIKVAETDLPDRFTNFSWHLIGGWGILVDRYIMRGEFAVPFEMSGYCEVLA